MPDMGFDSLTSARLRLRRFREADLPFFCRYRADPEVARFQSWSVFTEADGRLFFDSQCKLDPDTPGAWFQLAIELRFTGEMVGDCALHTLATDDRQSEIGFTLASQSQGHGYATESLTCLLDYVFRNLGKHRVIAVTDVDNHRAARVLERVGFRREGHFLQNIWFKGKWADEYLYAILREEWIQRGSSPYTCRGQF
jgi:RimJ/RimL family protein N-acetyltransferase